MVWDTFEFGRYSELVYMPRDPDSKQRGVTATIYLEVLEDILPTLWKLSRIGMPIGRLESDRQEWITKDENSKLQDEGGVGAS